MRFIFAAILARASLYDRLATCAGAVIEFALTAILTTAVLGEVPAALWLVAPTGASALLNFAVSAGPLAQPWPMIGGAAPLTAVFGGPAVAAAGWVFPILPVCTNAAILAATGVIFHRVSRHSYPDRPALGPMALPPPGDQPTPHPEDLDAALADLGETFDIGREDLDQLFERVRIHAEARRPAN